MAYITQKNISYIYFIIKETNWTAGTEGTALERSQASMEFELYFSGTWMHFFPPVWKLYEPVSLVLKSSDTHVKLVSND